MNGTPVNWLEEEAAWPAAAGWLFIGAGAAGQQQTNGEHGKDAARAPAHRKPAGPDAWTSDWQGMEIQAQTRTPVRFMLFNGDKEQMVDPPHQARHLEYQHVWRRPHTLVEQFVWKPAA